MILDLDYVHTDFIEHILPFTTNGIFIDTSVIKILITGFIETEISKRYNNDYDKLLKFFDIIKINNQWHKFLITPHILSEVCGDLHVECSKKYGERYKDIVNKFLPVFKEMREREVEKDRILNWIDPKKPIIEIGDISIFLATEDFINSSKKVSILAKDWGFNKKYKDNPGVMVMDFHKIPYSVVLNG